MKKFLLVSFCLVCLCLITKAQTNAVDVKLSWSYPTNELIGTSFKLYNSTDVTIPLANWVVFTNVLEKTNVIVKLVPNKYFFSIRASNFWGDGPFSTVLVTLSAPQTNLGLSITRETLAPTRTTPPLPNR